MNRRTMLLVLAVMMLTGQVYAQQPFVPPRVHPDAGSWNDLFNQDLSDAIFEDQIWSFTDGVLAAEEDQVIWTGKSYDNCMLDLEFRTEAGANSGVIVYCSDINDWIPNSVEIQITDDYSEKWANSPGTWRCGAIFGHLAARKQMVKKPGEWNRMTITCKDNMIYVILNNEPVTEMDMSLWTSAETNPDGSEIPAWLSTPFAELPTSGRIGLQGRHADARVYFRNLKVKEIE